MLFRCEMDPSLQTLRKVIFSSPLISRQLVSTHLSQLIGERPPGDRRSLLNAPPVDRDKPDGVSPGSLRQQLRVGADNSLEVPAATAWKQVLRCTVARGFCPASSCCSNKHCSQSTKHTVTVPPAEQRLREGSGKGVSKTFRCEPPLGHALELALGLSQGAGASLLEN